MCVHFLIFILMTGDKFKFAQLNLHRSNTPSLLFDRYCLLEGIDFALFQEPHSYNGIVTGLKSGKVEVDRRFVSPRAGIMVKRCHEYMVLNEFCSRDIMTILVDCKSNTCSEKVLICSAYLPGDELLPAKLIWLFRLWNTVLLRRDI